MGDIAGAEDAKGKRRLPRWVPYFNAIARPLIALGIPMGPDVLLTVRGRKSGLPRTTPVTICDYGGRRGFISPFGETNWARNLRAAGSATIRFGRKREEVRAIELEHDDAVRFIKEVIVPIAATSKIGDWFVRNIDRIDLDHPDETVIGKPVFEVFSATGLEIETRC
jgi:deazaflavin-dependent oxidoreductase (nitroreductase family)